MNPTAAILLGLACVCTVAGTALIDVPSALIVAGVLLALLGILSLDVDRPSE